MRQVQVCVRPSTLPMTAVALIVATLVTGCPARFRALRPCALSGDATPPWEGFPFAAGCGAAVDFGMLAIGVPATEILALYHDGAGEPVTVESIVLADVSGEAAAFTLSFFVSSGGSAPTPASLPLLLDPPESDGDVPPQVLYVRIDFDGSVNPFPAEQLQITSDDEGLPVRLLAIAGAVSECTAGLLDCDADPANGCEVDVGDPATCGATCAELVDCAMQASTDTDGAADAYDVPGEVTDYTGCVTGACASDTYADTCTSDVLTEYAASGASFTMTDFDCTTLESLYCQTGTLLYRDVWTCAGTPGACADDTDVLETDCSTVSGCTGVCGSGINGCAYSTGACTAGSCVGGASDVDLSMTQCAGCSLNWGIGGDTAATACCGDDSAENLTVCADDSMNGDCGGDTSACCVDASGCVDAGGSCRTPSNCHPFGTAAPISASYCNAGTWEDPDEAMAYCEATGCEYAWAAGGGTPAGSACCGDDASESLRTCGESGSGGTCGAGGLADACCSGGTDCVDAAGACRTSGQCHPFGTTLDSYCDTGVWENPDASMGNCTATGCSYVFGAGGNVAPANCCGDDAGENIRNCIGDSANGACGTDTTACCSSGTACVDHTGGGCYASGSCAVFGLNGEDSYCDSGTWQDPDESASFCAATGCGHEWMAGTANACCGDDTFGSLEDLESGSAAEGCCYNAGFMADGARASTDSLLCSNGSLFDCLNNVSDASSLDATDVAGALRESYRCDAGGRWCELGTMHCSGSTTCETDLDANPSCSGASALGTGTFNAEQSGFACGGVACDSEVTVMGTGEAYFTFDATNGMCACAGERIQLNLVVPTGIDYDLDLFAECGGTLLDSSSGGTGADEEVHECYCGSCACGTVTDFYVRISWVSGYSCSPWALTLNTHNCGTCP